MTARYVLTSACIQTGTMALTVSLRQRLLGKERVRFVDEDGEVYEGEVDWKAGVVRGLGPYYAKRRLAVNETILLHFRGEEVELKAAPRSQGRAPAPEPSRPEREEPRLEKRRVRVAPYPKEVLFPHEPQVLEPPGVTEDLRRLGFVLEGGLPWVYKAPLGRRQVVLALLRLGEGEPALLKPYRREGSYPAYLAPESHKAQVPEGFGHVSPEAIGRLVRLKARFPVSALDLEDLLRQGRVDLEAVEALEDRLVAELSERGAFAALLLLLAKKPLGQVFLLSDLEAEALEEGLIPEVVRKGVELLASPPFLVLKRLSPGEFLLRQEVEEALSDLQAFAEGLKARLNRVREGA
ncbi:MULTISPECIES: hypothetical protein [Thermus]|jgi:hypothetical protein|uniref:Uncharacterized protein n=1 Tax=Thermus brockianus TaxID=56956 RepID=A0A1J0LVS8_THEBO|nr:hypothetical protein [Thermus brockianus]APD10218.1 hypothetical protein A0O31_02166 [Thermus brockianus]BDG16505.1 hypothetical protein TbrSNM41_12390 [Thermus brockianus]